MRTREGEVAKLITLVGTRSDGDFRLRIELASPEGRVSIGDSLPQGRAALGRRVLVALHAIQRLLGGIEDEGRRIISEEALSHVHDGLVRRCLGGLVDEGPDVKGQPRPGWGGFAHGADRPTHQTSFRWPDTLAAERPCLSLRRPRCGSFQHRGSEEGRRSRRGEEHQSRPPATGAGYERRQGYYELSSLFTCSYSAPMRVGTLPCACGRSGSDDLR